MFVVIHALMEHADNQNAILVHIIENHVASMMM